MCRHVAYLGTAASLESIVSTPPHSLLRQSWAPRRQRYGTVNADGFGVGWYADGDPIPARYRSGRPMWTDASFVDLARVVRTRCMLAAVRDGTPGMPYGEAAAAPFASGRHLFSHNGVVPGWPQSIGQVAAGLSSTDLMTLEAPTDSAVLWALVRQRLDGGRSMADAVTAVVTLVAATSGGRLNVLLTDGVTITATAYGDTLCWRAGPGGLVVASEPFDDEPGWTDVPDGSLVTATPDGVTVEPLQEPRHLPYRGES